MNEEIQIQIIELMDDGATIDSSPKLKALVNASKEATEFYESLLVSESMLEGFFGGDKAEELNAKAESFINRIIKNKQKRDGKKHSIKSNCRRRKHTPLNKYWSKAN